MKKKQIPLIVLTAIVLSSCDNKTGRLRGAWDGNDYYTRKDSLIDGNTYRYSGRGYWYRYNAQNEGTVTRYYPTTGCYDTLPAAVHRSGAFLASSRHIANGGLLYPGSAMLPPKNHGGAFGGIARSGGFGGGHCVAA